MVMWFEYGCSSYYEKNKCTFYQFPLPATNSIPTEWRNAIKRSDEVPVKNNYLCTYQKNFYYQSSNQECDVKSAATEPISTSCEYISTPNPPASPRSRDSYSNKMHLSTNPFFYHSIDKLCTICHVILEDRDSTHSIFSTIEELGSSVIQILQSFANFHFYNVPQMYVCTTCYHKTIEVYKFTQMCNKAHENMQQYLKSKIGNDIDLDLKIEEIDISPTGIIVDGHDQNFDEINETFIFPTKIKIEEEETSKNEEMFLSCIEIITTEEEILREEMKYDVTRENEEIVNEEVKNDNTAENKKVVNEESSISDPITKELKQKNLVKRKTIKTCDYCHRTFRSDYFRAHIRSHTGERPYKCESCNKTFKNINNLHDHKKSHSNERPCICQECGRAFKLPGALNNHLRMHSTGRPFKCKICNKTFTYKIALKNHLSTHSDDKPFTCEYCSKAFKLPHLLKSHLRVHATVKPHKCEICNKDYANPMMLKYHQSAHSNNKPFICHCGKAFILLGALKKHETTHSNERPYKCTNFDSNACQESLRVV